MEATEQRENALANLRQLAQERKLEELESAWMELAENPAMVCESLGQLVEIAELLLKIDRDPNRPGTLLELLQAHAGSAPDGDAVLRYHHILLRCFPARREYKAAFAERFEATYPLASAERVFYEASGLTGSVQPAVALARLEKLLKYREGAYVFHASGWGVGKILAVDPFLRQVRVDLEHKRDHRVSIDVLDSILEPLPPDGYHVLRSQGGEGLRRLRDEEPTRLVSLVMDAFGETQALKDLKARLVPLVVDASGWSKWWNRAKALLRETGKFRIGDRAPYTVQRLESAVSYEDELIQRYRKAEWPVARQIAKQVARRSPGELGVAWTAIEESLRKKVAGKDAATAIEAAMILDRDLAASAPDVLKALIGPKSREELVSNLQEIALAEDQKRVVECLPQARPDDWIDIAVLLFLGKKDSLREASWDLLSKLAPERGAAAVADLLKAPSSAPEAFCFSVDALLLEQASPLLDPLKSKSPRELLVLVMDLMDHLQHRSQRLGRVAFRDLMGRVEVLFVHQDSKLFNQGIRAMELRELTEIHARLVRNDSLAAPIKGLLLELLREVEPTLGAPIESLPWDEDCIYALPEGLERKKAEFREIMEVKLPKVFEDIGRAAAFGDLSENAEYTAALEERDHLTKRATRMKEDLDKVRLITAEKVPTTLIGLGSRLRIRNLRSNEEHIYSLLGPWDGGPEDGVLNYLSPLGRLFYGKGAGEEVDATLPGGTERFRILSVGSHFHS